MKPHAKLTPRLAFGLCGLGGMVWLGAAHAQSVTPAPPTTLTPPTPPSAATTWSATNLPGTNVYQDKFIDGGTLVPDISKGETDTASDQGLARSLQIDGVVSALSSRGGGTSTNLDENGILAKSQWETVSYGAWSLDGSARAGGSGGPNEQGQGGSITLRERAMPFDGGWQADNGVGDLNTPDIGLARLEPRFILPTSLMQGLTTEWRGPQDLQLVAGGGVPGLYNGIVVPDFQTLGGTTATAGAQWSPASHWTVGGQFIEAHDTNLAIGTAVDGDTRFSSNTELLTAAWKDGGERLDLNLVDGDISGKSNAVGGWADGSITQGRFQQSAGLFRIDPNMTWGNQLIANDMEGGYYRLGYQGLRWMTDVGIDEVHSVSGLGSDTTFLTGDAHYQLSRDWGVGSIANVSRTDGGTAWSLEGFVDHPNVWGAGRAQADFAKTQMGQDVRLTLNQAWATPVGIRFSTSTYVEQFSGAISSISSGAQPDSTILGLGAVGGGQMTSKLGLEGNVNWAGAVQGRAAPGVSANVSLTYRLSYAWEMLVTYYDSHTGSWTPPTVESPLSPPVPTAIPAQDERGIFLTFRYKRTAGSHFAPLGGGPGAGSGEIAGVVYLDANNNGQLDAGESGAPNVTVLLDGRFSVQTDAAGRFHFPVVVTGHHVITVIPDNLPLPWVLSNAGRAEIEVKTRDRTEVNIAAQRPR
ncbi:MAG TPA: hypothetical protein VNV61_10680 [Steroidobacteraceae bacterium]|jgi:hypothetical protein|nr:hypothetical protein [Steroidobacteraceae bacterium]